MNNFENSIKCRYLLKIKSMIMLMNSEGEILIDTKEIKHNLEDFEK